MKNNLEHVLSQKGDLNSAEERMKAYLSSRNKLKSNAADEVEKNVQENTDSEQIDETSNEHSISNYESATEKPVVSIADTLSPNVINALNDISKEEKEQPKPDFKVKLLGDNSSVPKKPEQEEKNETETETKGTSTETIKVQLKESPKETNVVSTDSGVKVSSDSIPKIKFRVPPSSQEPEKDTSSVHNTPEVETPTNHETTSNSPSGAVRVKLKPLQTKDSGKVETNSGIKVDSKDIPNKLLNVNEKKNNVKIDLSNVSSNAKQVENTPNVPAVIEEKPKKVKKDKNSISFTEKLQKFSQMNFGRFFKITTIVLFVFFIVLVFFSAKSGESVINTESKYVPTFIKKIIDLDPKDILSGKEDKTSSLTPEEELALRQGKPLNFYTIENLYEKNKIEDKYYQSFLANKKVVLIDGVHSNLTTDNKDSGIMTGWAIETNDSKKLKEIKDKSKVIEVVIESWLNGKSPEDLDNKENNEQAIKTAIQTILPNTDFNIHRTLYVHTF